MPPAAQDVGPEPHAREFYCQTMATLRQVGVPFLVGGAYAFERYTRIARHTKDFDIFVHPRDCERALGALVGAGYRAEPTYPHWLAKVYHGDTFVDVIYRSQNGLVEVDDAWFDHAVVGDVFGQPAQLMPAEEMLWTKALVMERERFDGADVAHILRARGKDLDWRRLLDRFADHWRVLLGHVVFFSYIYPSEREQVPRWVMDDLLRRLQADLDGTPPADRVCYGPVISREQYLIDIQQWGYRDARLQPGGPLTPDDLVSVREAIEEDA